MGGQVDAVTGRARQLLEPDHLLDELGARIPARVSDPASGVLVCQANASGGGQEHARCRSP